MANENHPKPADAAEKLAADLEVCSRERDDAYKSLNEDQAEYDKQLLVLSAGFLALALGFIKDIVPLPEAIHLYALYLSFWLLALCVFVVLGSYQYSIMGNFRVADYWEKKSATLVAEAEHRSRLENELGVIQSKIARHAKRIKFVNRSSGVLFVTAVIIMVYFVVSNLQAHSHVSAPQHVSSEWR